MGIAQRYPDAAARPVQGFLLSQVRHRRSFQPQSARTASPVRPFRGPGPGGEGWFRRTSLLFDRTFLLASPGNWRLDVRTRLQYLADENRLQYIRIQPRLWRSFNWRGLGWWIYNDFYFRLVDTGTGSVTNYSSNNFSTGFKLPLNAAADISLYYMVFSMLAQQSSPRKNIHQACISFGWHFGGNSDSFPAVRN